MSRPTMYDVLAGLEPRQRGWRIFTSMVLVLIWILLTVIVAFGLDIVVGYIDLEQDQSAVIITTCIVWGFALAAYAWWLNHRGRPDAAFMTIAATGGGVTAVVLAYGLL